MTNLEVFEKAVNDYMSYFGMNTWEYYCNEQMMEDRAQVHINMAGRIANFYLNSGISADDNIRKEAFHEVLELLLAELSQFAFNASVIPEEEKSRREEEQTHIIIRTFENTIFKDLESLYGDKDRG